MKKEWIDGALGKEWTVTPAGGATGEAYVAEHEKTKLFIKVNASPFLAVLSAEGIVPKLVWTKRIENGDVISAQQWADGQKLKPEEMKSDEVALLLKKIHTSSDLFEMFKRIQSETLLPNQLLGKIESHLTTEQRTNQIIHQGMMYLSTHIPEVNLAELVVCHGDLTHHNVIQGKNGQLYLIDWDNAFIADPALDLTTILHCYVPNEQWSNWLDTYGISCTKAFEQRLIWYIIAQTLHMYQWFSMKENTREATRCFQELERYLRRYKLI